MVVREQWDRLAAAYGSRPRAEKVILAVVLLAVPVWLYMLMFFDPQRAEMATAERQMTTTEARISSMQARLEQAQLALSQDPNRALEDRIERLIREQRQARGSIEDLAGNLVPPYTMTRVLTSVLDSYPGLELVRVENRQPNALRSGSAGSATSSATDGAADGESQDFQGQVYRHGLTLEFRGSYLNTLEYLQYLESFDERFFWDSLDLRIETWPEARVILELHTLSGQEGFVGV